MIELRKAGDDQVVVLPDLRPGAVAASSDIKKQIADVLTFNGDRIVSMRLHVALRNAGLDP